MYHAVEEGVKVDRRGCWRGGGLTNGWMKLNTPARGRVNSQHGRTEGQNNAIFILRRMNGCVGWP